jgi:desulfoferrodoxin (superoxide reductase-like protein)
MIPDGSYTAVVDRFEDSQPVLELSSEDDRYELVVEQGELPQPARHVDAILEVELVDGKPVEAEYKPAESTQRAEEAQNRFDRLSKRPPDNEES